MRHTRISAHGRMIGGVALLAVLVCCLGATSALAAPVIGPSGQAFYTPPSPLPSGGPGTLIWYRPVAVNLGSDAPAVAAYDVLYVSEDEVGFPDVVSGVVLVPTSAWSGWGPRPVVDYAWGTQGLAQDCAASVQLANGTEYDGAAAVASLRAGYAVVATDYQGYTNGSIPTYVAGAAEGHAVLDVVRAAEQVPGDGISASNRVIVWGYSQGGGAATWAGVLQPQYAPDVDLIGVAAGGVPANLDALTTFSDDSVDSAFTMYAMIGFAQAYHEIITPALLFNAAGKAFAKQLETQGCALNDIGPPISDREINQYLNLSLQTVEGNPLTSSVVTWSDLGATPVKVPYFQYSGEYDEFVPLLQQITLKQQFCSEGVADDYHLYPGDHLLADPIATPDVIAWIANLLAGGVPPSTCSVNATLPAGARTTPETGDLTIPVTGWALSGGIQLRALGMLEFPAGSTLSAVGDLTSDTLSGSASVPTIDQTISVLGIPIPVVAKLTTTPITGTVSLSSSGTLTLGGGTQLDVTLQSAGNGSLRIPAGCHTSSPIDLSLDVSESAVALATGKLSASGTTTIPSWTGCGVLGPALNLLGSGPSNPFSVTLTTPAATPF